MNILFNNKNINIKFGKVTQIGILDIELANEIYVSFLNYFSNKKINTFELERYGGIMPEFYLDKDTSLGKYRIVGISSLLELETILEYKKDSILNKYNKILMEDLDIQLELFELEKTYSNIIKKIYEKTKSNSLLRIKEFNVNSDYISDKNIELYLNKSNRSIDKILEMIDIVGYISDLTMEEYILYFHLIEGYVLSKEVNKIIKKVEGYKGIKLIISATRSDYLDYKNVENINFCIDGRMAQLPTLEMLQDKINLNIKGNCYIEIEDVKKMLNNYAFEIIKGSRSAEMDVRMVDALLAKQINREEKEIVKLIETLII